MQQPSKLPITDIESVSMGANALKDYFESDDVRNSSYKSFALTLKRHCPDKKFIRQVLFIAKAIIENGNTQKANEQLYTEIKMEFDLY